MRFSGYSDAWRIPAVREALLLGTLGKAPWFGAVFALTLHVVGPLGETYAAAGVLSACFTIAVALASPIRGRLLDRIGLRRTLAPSIAVLPIAFIIGPRLPYLGLLIAMVVVGLLAIPWFVVTRQTILGAAPLHVRRSALALDAVLTEVAFMVGPTIAILLAESWHPGHTLTLLGLLSTSAGVVLVWRNPRLTVDAPRSDAPGAQPARWVTGPVVTTFVATFSVAFILGGSDLSMVAAARAFDVPAGLAMLIIGYGLGSLTGGLFYGSLPHGRLGLRHLIGGLAVATLLAAVGVGLGPLVALMALAGLFCAPSLTAITERIGEVVPEARRGEAFGWQGTFSTLGNASAPPLVGWAIDTWGWHAGFGTAGAVGLLLAGVGWVALHTGRRGVQHHRARQTA